MKGKIKIAYQSANELADTMLRISCFRDERFFVTWPASDDDDIDAKREAEAIRGSQAEQLESSAELRALREFLFSTQVPRFQDCFKSISHLLDDVCSGLDAFALANESGTDIRLLVSMACQIFRWAGQSVLDECPYNGMPAQSSEVAHPLRTVATDHAGRHTVNRRSHTGDN